MHPFVEPDQMTGIEGRPQPAAGQGSDHGLVDRPAFDADSGRFIPGDQPLEIGLCRLQEGVVVLGDQAAAGSQAAP